MPCCLFIFIAIYTSSLFSATLRISFIFLSLFPGAEDAADKLAKCEITEPTFNTPSPSLSQNSSLGTPTDPAKRLKNLRKKLRDIETLEEKIKSGTLKSPDKDQKEKMSKKNVILKEIDVLEKEISE